MCIDHQIREKSLKKERKNDSKLNHLKIRFVFKICLKNKSFDFDYSDFDPKVSNGNNRDSPK